MTLHKFGPISVNVEKRNFFVFFYRAQGVSATCIGARANRLRITCTTHNLDGSAPTQSDTCTNCDGLNVNATWAWGFNVPLLATGYHYSGSVEVNGQVFDFNGDGVY
jgi:hypothetical protein